MHPTRFRFARLLTIQPTFHRCRTARPRLAVHARLRHLAGDGAFKPFSQRLDLRALGCELVAFMSLWVSQADPAILAGLLAVPGVVAVRSTTRRRQHPHAGRRENIRDLHRITRSILAVDGVVAAAPPSPWTRSSPAGRTPCSASPPAGADPYAPSPALNSRRSLYSLRQWRDSHHLLFDREPARWTSQ